MTILKYKEPSISADARQAAGDRQEHDVAFYLRRAFKDDENIWYSMTTASLITVKRPRLII